MARVFGDSFLKEMVFLVLFSFVVLKLEIFTFEQVTNGAFLVVLAYIVLAYIIVKSFRGLKRQRAVLFDFGGVVAEGNYFTEPLRIRKGMPELVNSLKKKNYKVALLTNQNAEVQDYLSKRHGLDRLFPEQIVSGKVGVKKPDPRIYRHALYRLKVRPQETFFVDDKEENVAGARKAGIRGIRFQSVQQVANSIC